MRLSYRTLCPCVLLVLGVYFLFSVQDLAKPWDFAGFANSVLSLPAQRDQNTANTDDTNFWLNLGSDDDDDVVRSWTRDPKDHFCVWFNYTKAEEAPNEESISLCTHASIGYSKFVFDHATHWDEHVSVALLLDEEGFPALATFRKLQHCTPTARARVSAHLVWRAENCSHLFVTEGLARLPADPMPDNCDLHTHLPLFRHRLRTPYPPNTLRNIARRGAGSPLHLVADIENHLSAGAAEIVRAVGGAVRNRSSVLVVRRFEVEEGEVLPRNVSTLYRLIKTHKAVPFHHFFWRNGHVVPDLDAWLQYSFQDTNPPRLTPVSYRGSNWEPQLVVHRDHPLHFEGLPIRFRDQQSMPYEVCRAGVHFLVVSHVFSFHQGIKRRATEAELAAKGKAGSKARIRHAEYRAFLAKTYPLSEQCGNW